MPPVLVVENVSKSYPMWANPSARLTAPLWGALGRGRLPGLPAGARDYCRRREEGLVRRFEALRGVSFELGRGESLGIVGRNGAGKSTLLQIIAGTLSPSTGQVTLRGRLTALLELGSGFNGEFTGRENIRLSCAVYGLEPGLIEAKIEETLAFAEIGDFVDQPLKTYSSGMMLRLAFAVQVALEPDLLIVDEALAVGDVFFQAKCSRLLRTRLEAGMSLLFVSHDPGSVKALCARALVLNRGAAVFLGESARAISAYEEIVQGERRVVALAAQASAAAAMSVPRGGPTKDWPADFPPEAELVRNWPTHDEVGSREAEFIHAKLLDVDGKERASFVVGEHARLELYFRAHMDLEKPVLGFQLSDRFGQVIYGLCSSQAGENATLPHLAAGEVGCYRIELPGRLGGGDYLFDATLGLGDRGDGAVEHHLHRVGGMVALNVRHPGMQVDFFGPANLEAIITHRTVAAGTSELPRIATSPEPALASAST